MTTRAQHAAAIEHEVGIAVRTLTPQRSAKVLASAHVAAIRDHQRALLLSKAAICKALDHGSQLLIAAGADGGGVRSLDDVRIPAATLTDELRRVRSKRRGF